MAFIPAYILILFATIIIDYIAGISIEKAVGSRKKLFLILSIISNLGILAFFKYYGFIGSNIAMLADWLHWNYSLPALSIILPIGLSFHTFQAMSYTIEVYRGHQKAERHLGIYSLYVLFYPQMVAGPIERPQNLLHQFREEHRFDRARVVSGLTLMLWGFFKKVVIADRAAMLVDVVYNDPTMHSGLPLILATVLFSFQIYYDFSGYSDIAIGAARVMGITLMKNFDNPYRSASVQEFWRRWHISLSTWFKDYVYVPLGGSRVTKFRYSLNLLAVFMLSGLWHGASWTFVIWGALHGAYLVISLLTKSWRERLALSVGLQRVPRLHQALRVLITYGLVCFAWIFFRANTLDDALYIVRHLFTGFGEALTNLQVLIHSLPAFNKASLFLVLFPIVMLEGVLLLNTSFHRHYRERRWVRWASYSAVCAWLLLFGVYTKQNFIYFQF